MDSSQTKLLSSLLRYDLSSFIAKSFCHLSPGQEFLFNWHIHVVADHLRAVYKGEIKRLIINMPPRHLKSICANVAWPSWIMGHNPASRIISVSYSRELSAKHALDARSVMTSHWYRRIFPRLVLSSEQNSRHKFMTTKNGFRLSTSIDSTITGEGADYIILDDPHNPAHIFSEKRRRKVIEWFERVIMSRLNDRKNGAIVLIMQRLHKDDLAGWLMSRNTQWTRLSLSIIADRDMSFNIRVGTQNNKQIHIHKGDILHENRCDMNDIEQIKQESGTYVFASQYMQNPIDTDNNPIKARWLKRYKEIPAHNRIVISWDTASAKAGGCYNVGSVWTMIKEQRFLLDVIRGQWNYNTLKQNIIESYNRWEGSRLLIENKSSGQQLINDLPSHIRITPVNPVGTKEERLLKTTVLFERGLVFFPEQAPWLFDLEYELLNFPDTYYNDRVDSISQYLNWTLGQNAQSSPGLRIL